MAYSGHAPFHFITQYLCADELGFEVQHRQDKNKKSERQSCREDVRDEATTGGQTTENEGWTLESQNEFLSDCAWLTEKRSHNGGGPHKREDQLQWWLLRRACERREGSEDRLISMCSLLSWLSVCCSRDKHTCALLPIVQSTAISCPCKCRI